MEDMQEINDKEGGGDHCHEHSEEEEKGPVMSESGFKGETYLKENIRGANRFWKLYYFAFLLAGPAFI